MPAQMRVVLFRKFDIESIVGNNARMILIHAVPFILHQKDNNKVHT